MSVGDRVRDETLPGVGWSTLWLPLRHQRGSWMAVAFVGLFYLFTMSRDLGFYDSAELAMTSASGGLSHPPGHPLYTMLGWFFAHLPGIPVLIGLNALSAIGAALAVIPTLSIAEALCGNAESKSVRWLTGGRLIPFLVAVLFIHPAFWEVATRVEVYSAASFFGLWGVARLAANLSVGDASLRSWLWVGVAFGLSASVNPVIATILAVSMTPTLLVAFVRGGMRRVGLAVLAGGGLVGLLCYLYLPLVAGREDVFVWGSPTSSASFQRYVTFQDFAHATVAPLMLIFEHILDWGVWAVEHGLLPLTLLGLVGHILLGRDRKTGIGLAAGPLSFACSIFFVGRNVIFFPDVADYLGYMMASLMLCAAGAAALVAHVASGGGRREWLGGVLGLAMVINVAIAAPTPFNRTRHLDRVARSLSVGALERAPDGAVFIAISDHWVFPVLYLQEVEGLRTDVVFIPRGLSGASWYWSYLYRRHPGLESFALRGPGGQPARIRRFLAANSGRPLIFESWEQAVSIGIRPACVGPWLLHDEAACSMFDGEPSDELTGELAHQLEIVGEGSPPAAAVIANVSVARGEMYWRFGRANEALHAFRAGVPATLLPRLSSTSPASAAPPLGSPLPSSPPSWAIGHHSHNLYIAGHLLRAAGAEADARAHLVAALENGYEVPEGPPRP